jgi:acyl carrier protein
MLPLYCLQLPQLPLTGNGKLDRRALPDPDLVREKEHAIPATEIELQLVEIWSEVLQLKKEAISISTSFFELGGHSLKAILLTNKINKEFGVGISIKDVFAKKTVQEQALFVEINEWLFKAHSGYSQKDEVTI